VGEICDDMKAELRKLDGQTSVALVDFFPSVSDLGVGCRIEFRIVAICSRWASK
jgi:hypothetical protein